MFEKFNMSAVFQRRCKAGAAAGRESERAAGAAGAHQGLQEGRGEGQRGSSSSSQPWTVVVRQQLLLLDMTAVVFYLLQGHGPRPF